MGKGRGRGRGKKKWPRRETRYPTSGTTSDISADFVSQCFRIPKVSVVAVLVCRRGTQKLSEGLLARREAEMLWRGRLIKVMQSFYTLFGLCDVAIFRQYVFKFVDFVVFTNVT